MNDRQQQTELEDRKVAVIEKYMKIYRDDPQNAGDRKACWRYRLYKFSQGFTADEDTTYAG